MVAQTHPTESSHVILASVGLMLRSLMNIGPPIEEVQNRGFLMSTIIRGIHCSSESLEPERLGRLAI